jgi:2-(1,2-epoxy-1,2-dihydrophenyl)acetyl-CoA isomerase
METIELTIEAGIARLRLNRPDAGNGISLQVAKDLMAATLQLTGDPSVRAVLVKGAGKNFCVGGDLKEFSGVDDLPGHLREVTTYLHAALGRLARLDAPVVAAVQGSAAGAGMSLACSADLTLVGESAKFVLAYGKVGLSPDGSGSWYLPRLVGLKRALELALTNRVLSAQDAVDWGIATAVHPDDALDDAAEALAAELSAGSMGAQAAAKRLLRESFGTTIETQMELETIAICANAGGDGAEGIAAFLEKRAPKFG